MCPVGECAQAKGLHGLLSEPGGQPQLTLTGSMAPIQKQIQEEPLDSLLSPTRRQAMEILAQLRYPCPLSSKLCPFSHACPLQACPFPPPLPSPRGACYSHTLAHPSSSCGHNLGWPTQVRFPLPHPASSGPFLTPHLASCLSQSHQAYHECAGEVGAGEHLCAERVLIALSAVHAGEGRVQGRSHPGELDPPGASSGLGTSLEGTSHRDEWGLSIDNLSYSWAEWSRAAHLTCLNRHLITIQQKSELLQ